MLAFLHTKSAISFNILSGTSDILLVQNYMLLAYLHTKSAISFNILSVQMICLWYGAIYKH